MNKASGGDGIPVKLFQILKEDAVKVLHSMSANLENSPVATGLEKVSFHSNLKEMQCQRMFKLPHNCTHLLKILQARLQQYMNHELSDVQTGFRKGRGIRDQIVNIHWVIEKIKESQKTIYFCFIDYDKAFDCEDHNKLWKILKEMGAQTFVALKIHPLLLKDGQVL